MQSRAQDFRVYPSHEINSSFNDKQVILLLNELNAKPIFHNMQNLLYTSFTYKDFILKLLGIVPLQDLKTKLIVKSTLSFDSDKVVMRVGLS